MRIEHEHITRPKQNWPEKERRRGAQPHWVLLLTTNSVITPKLFHKRGKKTQNKKRTTKKKALFNAKEKRTKIVFFFFNLLLWVDQTLGYPPFGAKGKRNNSSNG